MAARVQVQGPPDTSGNGEGGEEPWPVRHPPGIRQPEAILEGKRSRCAPWEQARSPRTWLSAGLGLTKMIPSREGLLFKEEATSDDKRKTRLLRGSGRLPHGH